MFLCALTVLRKDYNHVLKKYFKNWLQCHMFSGSIQISGSEAHEQDFSLIVHLRSANCIYFVLQYSAS